MLSIWMTYNQHGKCSYLPNQENWSGRIALEQSETGWPNRIVFPVRSLDAEWFLELPEGFSWADKNSAAERPIANKDNLGIIGKYGNITVTVSLYDREHTIYTKYLFPDKNRLTIGRDNENDLCVDNPRMSAHHGMITRVNPQTYVYQDKSEHGTYINGTLLKGGQKQLAVGDRLDIPESLSLILLQQMVAVNHTPDLAQITKLQECQSSAFADAASGERTGSTTRSVYMQFHRSPRRLQKPNENPFEIESPLPMAVDNEMPAFLQLGPSMTMVLPMATMALFINNGPASLVMVGTSAGVAMYWAVLNRKYRKKKFAQDEELRLVTCRQYYAETEEKLIVENNRERDRLLNNYLSIQECINLPTSDTHRLWERMPAHQDFLNLRLGVGEKSMPMQIDIPKEKLSLTEDPLRYEPRRLKDKYSILLDVPITVDVIKHHMIGILGNERTPWVMQNMVVQAAANHSYNDVRIALLYTSDTRQVWEWTKWLPHVFSSDDRLLRMVVSEPSAVRQVLSHLDTALSIRAEAAGEKSKPAATEEGGAPYAGDLPYYLVFVTDPALIENHPITRYMTAQDLGFSLIVQASSMEQLPKECKLIIEAKTQLGTLYTDDGDVTGVQYDLASSSQLEGFSKKIAPLRVRDAQGSAAIPSYLTFLDVYKSRNVQDMDVWRYWSENKTYESINSYLGVRAGSQPFALNIKFGTNGHGPHGLLAGTTGSGKSILLQSLILSLAVNYSPRDVQFVLIDYKGGGTSDVFRNLPHVVGVIDNLQGERAIYRALASIDGEIKRRQILFKQVEGGGIADIDDYIRLAEADVNMEKLSHLVVVIDEFAELKADQPDFMASMVKAARVGRSAGIHLILATQTPSGSVSDEIKANTNFRICLRVADSSESRYMLGRPDAAYLRGMGRAYVQVGNDEVFEMIQTSYSGAVYDPNALTSEEEPRILDAAGSPIVIKKKASKGGARAQKQLDAVLNRISEVVRLHNLPIPANLWFDRMPFILMLDTLPPMRGRIYGEAGWPELGEGPLTAPCAVADNISEQKYDDVALNFTNDKNHLVVGLPGTGKTTFLQTIALSLALRYPPSIVNLYVFSLTGGLLRSLEALPHVADIVYDEQLEDQLRMMDVLYKEDNRRKVLLAQASSGNFEEYNRGAAKADAKHQPLVAIVVLIDRIQQIRDWDDLKHKDSLDKFYELLQTASSRGIYFVMTALAASELQLKYQPFVKRIALQLNDRSDYMDALNVRIPADEWNGVDMSPGRGVVVTENGILEMQAALFGTDKSDSERTDMILELGALMQSAWKGERPEKLPRIPPEPRLSDLLGLPKAQAMLSQCQLPLGYDKQSAQAFSVELKANPSFLIVGAQKSGKTTLIKTLASTFSLLPNAAVSIVGGSDLCAWARQQGFQTFAPADPTLIEHLTGLRTALDERLLSRSPAAQEGTASCGTSQQHQPLVLLIDDVDTLIAQGDKNALEALSALSSDTVSAANIYLAVSISHARFKENSLKPPVQNLTKQKRGFMLQGKISECDPFSANVSYAMKSMQLPTGEGYYTQEGQVSHLVLPFSDEEQGARV